MKNKLIITLGLLVVALSTFDNYMLRETLVIADNTVAIQLKTILLQQRQVNRLKENQCVTRGS